MQPIENSPSDDGLSAPIERVMSVNLLLASEERPVSEVAKEMLAREVGAVAVLGSKGEVAGLFTERDLLTRVVGKGRDPNNTPLGDVMTRAVKVLEASTTIMAASTLLNTYGFRHVPVVRDGRLVGMVSMRDLMRARLRHIEALRDEEIRSLQGLRAMLAQSDQERVESLMAVNKRLQEMALTDELTGLYNHRYFADRLNQEVVRALRTSTPLALLFADIDHFKLVNDTYGHPGGDRVLVHVAAVLRAAVEGASVIARLRRSDIVARYGGEEFAMLLPDARSDSAAVVAERVRATLEDTPATLPDGRTLKVTISIGVASIPESASESAGLLRAADEALYRAKQAGRNQVARG